MSEEIKNIAALYCRVSKEDENEGQSSSIKTQKAMLERYAQEQNFKIYECYIDDGYSGTNFDRPEFQRMIADAQLQKFNIIIVKDLSRLGRDYAVTGIYLEQFFPKNKIRFIAITDNHDSNNKWGNDMVAMKNVMNELYASDISKKIRSAFEEKMKAGKYIGNFAPYGYLKSPEDKNKLIINEETAPIVKEMFNLAKQNYRPKDIADYLNEKGIDSPAVYKCKKYPQCNINNYSERKEWTSANVQKMLKNVVYIGCLEQHKTSKLSFKSKVTMPIDKNERYIVEGTHEPIIDVITFETVNNIIKSRRKSTKTNFKNVFSGIAKCETCGSNMSATGTRKKGAKYNLECGKYKLYGSKECTNHFIDYNELYENVLNEINKYLVLDSVQQDRIIKELRKGEKNVKNDNSKRISQLKNRKEDISKVLNKLYEDNYLNKISEERFESMTKNYDAELSTINIELKELEAKKELTESEKYKNFFSLIKGMKKLEVLTPEIVSSLIEKIEISQGEYIKENDKKIKKQRIKIYFKFINEGVKKP